MKLFTTPNSKIYSYNFKYSYNRKIWVDIPSYVIFPGIVLTIGDNMELNPGS